MKSELRKNFTDQADLLDYIPQIWENDEIKTLVDYVNDRFEDKLRHAVTVRNEIRTGVRVSDEKISVTIYEWISRFMARTHRLELIEDVTVAGVKGHIELNLYEHTAEFIPEE